ncbi:MAG TPA: hypothetical protein VKU19_29115 [Bryobacteraceae bacterium]|nr:hypothetical protein [Bryobacteraceae bacterium]
MAQTLLFAASRLISTLFAHPPGLLNEVVFDDSREAGIGGHSKSVAWNVETANMSVCSTLPGTNPN